MQKPITVVVADFEQSLITTANESGLPFFIMEPVIKGLLESVQEGARRQAEMDRAAYGRYLQEQEEEKSEAATAPSAADGVGACSVSSNAKPSKSEG